MAVRVLVVDDSGFFRRRLIEIFSAFPGLDVIGEAVDGQQAVQAVARLQPDVVTMDVEMPVMDGISAVRKIMATTPVPIMMFSSLTSAGAQATLQALDAGAVDFMPKRLQDIAAETSVAIRQLCERVSALGQRRVTDVVSPEPPGVRQLIPRHHFQLLAIGLSTGGPAVLPRILSLLSAGFPMPILLIQHMPGSFTSAFAQRLNDLSRITVREADDGDILQPGTAYLAPGGTQMVVSGSGGAARLSISPGEPNQTYQPSVDITFASLADVYADKVLAIVMTGMGSDGCEGARKLKAVGATIWAQDEASCVVYGMPAAVTRAGLVDQILSPDAMGTELGAVA